MAKDKIKTKEAPAPTTRKKGEPNVLKIARHAERMEKAETRREAAISEATTTTLRSGKKRSAILARADRCATQRERISKKAETRRRLAALKPSERREARAAGDKQFGPAAPEYHRMKISPDAYAALKKGGKSESPLVALQS